MAGRIKIPPVNPSSKHAPLSRFKPGSKSIDLTDLAELEREEAELRASIAHARANSKKCQVSIPGPIYKEILKLAKRFDRKPPDQVLECIQIGVKFYDSQNTPHYAPRPLNYLPEVREGEVMDTALAEISPPAPRRGNRTANNWLSDAGLPALPTRTPFAAEPIAIPAIEEPEPEEAEDNVEVAL
jgi:hypothetical protein